MPRPTMPAPTDDDRAGARDVFASESDRAAASRFGVGLFLITLSMLFGAVMLLLIALRWDGAFRLEDMPPLPWQVWLSRRNSVTAHRSAVLLATRECRTDKGCLVAWQPD